MKKIFQHKLVQLIPVILALVLLYWLIASRAGKKEIPAAPVGDTSFHTHIPAKEIIPQPSKISRLPDSTRVFLINGNGVTIPANFSKQHSADVDGDVFFEIYTTPSPFLVHTKLMNLTVTKPSAFRVIAYRQEEGEEVQVLYGNIIVRKAYKSDYNVPDTLEANQMFMINRSIDLGEKEKFDAAGLRAWRDTVRH